MTDSAKRRIVLAAIATTSLLVAVVLAYHIARRASSPAPQVAGLNTATSSTSADSSANSLALSVFERPRHVPEIPFQDDQSHELRLAEFRDRVVLLNIWATWCVPCRQEMPALDRLEARLGGKDFLAIYLDPSGKGSHALAIPGVPTTLLIDREGREVARKMGAAEWDGPEMVSLIERTIRGESPGKAAESR